METKTEHEEAVGFFIDKYKIVLNNIKSQPFYFFHYLKSTKRGDGLQLLSEVNCKTLGLVKDISYYEVLTFKTFICELIYNGINLFPEICQYTIICKNEKGISYLTFGLFDDIADDGHPCMATFKCYQNEKDTEPIIYHLELKDIKHLYCNNRHQDVDSDCVNTLMILLYMGGISPNVSTTSKVNKTHFKNILKIK